MTIEDFEATFASFADIEDLVVCFETGTLSRTRWTHHAHLIVGLWCISHYEESEAIRRIRSGIKSHNIVIGTVDSPTTGYHETMTLAWARLVRDYLVNSEEKSIESYELYAGLIRKFNDRGYIRNFYSRELLMSPEARAGWIEPDLMPLP